MNPKHALKYLVHVVMVVAGMIPNVVFAQDTARPKLVIEERLPVPLGTVAKMKIVIVDGEELNDKGHQSSFLLKVRSVNGTTLIKPIIIEFRDETGKFPNGVFELYKYLNGKEAGSISSKESEKIKKKYIGKEFNIAGYETGEFTGIPMGYTKYQPVRQDYGFHFRQFQAIYHCYSGPGRRNRLLIRLTSYKKSLPAIVGRPGAPQWNEFEPVPGGFDAYI